MKYSVKRKIAVAFIGVMTVALLGVAILNYAFLGTYYTYQKVDTLKTGVECAGPFEYSGFG